MGQLRHPKGRRLRNDSFQRPHGQIARVSVIFILISCGTRALRRETSTEGECARMATPDPFCKSTSITLLRSTSVTERVRTIPPPTLIRWPRLHFDFFCSPELEFVQFFWFHRGVFAYSANSLDFAEIGCRRVWIVTDAVTHRLMNLLKLRH
jgi:hypothetical protein